MNMAATRVTKVN